MDTKIAPRASSDATTCLKCKRRFSPDDIRLNVYQDDKLIGRVHDNCYEDLYAER